MKRHGVIFIGVISWPTIQPFEACLVGHEIVKLRYEYSRL